MEQSYCHWCHQCFFRLTSVFGHYEKKTVFSGNLVSSLLSQFVIHCASHLTCLFMMKSSSLYELYHQGGKRKKGKWKKKFSSGQRRCLTARRTTHEFPALVLCVYSYHVSVFLVFALVLSWSFIPDCSTQVCTVFIFAL